MTAFQPDQLVDTTAVGPDGDKIGKIGQVYLDDQTGQPTWVTVSTGLLGRGGSFAPLYGAHHTGEDLQLAVTKDQVKDAPNVEDDAHISEPEQRSLYDYYAGLLGSGAGWQSSDTGYAQGTTEPRTGGGTDDAMTRSEEQLHVGTENVETGRARLRKYVVTENVTQTVPVSHEEVRIEREPITEANVDEATSGPAISEAEHEVTLHEERPVVSKETVPVERVRMNTDTITEEETVNESVRKEQIEVEGDERGAGSKRGR